MASQMKVAEFCSITGADAEFAASFLEAADWDVASAVDLYLGGSGNAASTTTTTRTDNNRTTQRGNTNNNDNYYSHRLDNDEDDDDEEVVVDDNEEEYMEEVTSRREGGGRSSSSSSAESGRDPVIQSIMDSMQVDYNTAKAIAEAQGYEGDASGSSSAAATTGEDGVRAPILQKRARLFDLEPMGGGVGGGGAGNVIMGGFGNLGMAMATGAIPLYEAALRNSVGADDAVRGGGRGTRGAGGRRQQDVYDMFGPPVDVLFSGTFEAARERAKTSQRWLLVNIQEQEEFQSLVLNRDLWAHEVIKELITGSFVFWQRQHNSEDGTRFIALYQPPRPFPHVCIIDPRTGERALTVKVHKATEGALRESFIEQITLFLDSHHFTSGKKSTTTTTTSSSSSSKDDAEEEDQDLARAIAASLAVKPSTSSSAPPPTVATTESPSSSHRVPALSPSAPPLSVSRPAPVSYGPIPEEPPAKHPDSTTIQFKMTDGAKVRRRFWKSAAVRELYAFVQQSSPPSLAFDLVTSIPTTKSLAESMTATVQEADLCNGSILVVEKKE